MTAIYLPVTKYEKYADYRYWSNNPYFFYGNLLVSPLVTGFDKSNIDFRDSEHKLEIYADSGGFQIARRNERVASLDVLRWQERIADIAFTVDVPPHSYLNVNGTTDYPKNYFLKCMKQSNKNADLMWRFKLNDEMKLWGVIQGRSFEECAQWYNDLTKNHEYDGYCISLSINKKDRDWINQLEFAKTIKKPIHFLGYSDKTFTLTLAKFSQIMKQTYTYDSSTSTVGPRYGKYLEPSTHKLIPISELKQLTCNCPVCLQHTVSDLRVKTELANLHNLYVKINFCNQANQIATDDELFVYTLTMIEKNPEPIIRFLFGNDYKINISDEKELETTLKEYNNWNINKTIKRSI